MATQYKPVKEMGEFYNTVHLLRPVNAVIVQEYAHLMLTGIKFPPIQLGEYTGANGKPSKIIIDGVHIYRAAVEAKRKTLEFMLTKYPDLASALAAQLKCNINQGLRLTSEQRDIRMRMLSEVYKWTQSQIAEVLGLSVSSISRILAGKQNLFKTGKRGRVTGTKATPAPVIQHALPPKVFFQTIERIHLTLSKGQSKIMVLSALQDPKQLAELPKMLLLLQQVASEVQQLLKLAVEASASPTLVPTVENVLA